MLNFLKKKQNSLVTVRAEDLQVADRFVYDNAALEVLDTHPGSKKIVVRLGSTHPGAFYRTRQIDLYNEMFVTVAR